MAVAIRLPGRSEELVVEQPRWADGYPPPTSRTAYAAAHVAARPDGSIDWESTLAFRDYLWDNGFGAGRRDGHRPTRHGPGVAADPGADRSLRGAGG